MSDLKATTVTTTTGTTLFSFCNVWEPKQINGQGDPKYSVSLVIPKTDTKTLTEVKTAIQNAIDNGVANNKFGGKNPASPSFKHPLRDGDLERPEDPAYKGCYFMNANSSQPVGVIGPNAKRISDFERDSFYSGCYGNFSVNFFPYNASGNVGIGCGLNAVQKVRDGERLAGAPDPETLFGAVDDNSIF